MILRIFSVMNQSNFATSLWLANPLLLSKHQWIRCGSFYCVCTQITKFKILGSLILEPVAIWPLRLIGLQNMLHTKQQTYFFGWWYHQTSSWQRHNNNLNNNQSNCVGQKCIACPQTYKTIIIYVSIYTKRRL